MSGAPRVALLLGGGGARAAYQVGVLKAVAEILPAGAGNPFPVICGSSAGGINAAVLACHAMQFQEGVRRLVGVWENFRVHHVFRADAWSALSRSSRWLFAMLTGGAWSGPRSILDVSPLRTLLAGHVAFDRIGRAIGDSALQAVCVTASSYTSGRSISFYQGAEELGDWSRARREGRRTRLGLDHLMASASIPILFPAVAIGSEYYGDGSMRQNAPVSPALHLGADRVLVIGVRREADPPAPEEADAGYPGVGQIAGYILDTLFLNSLSADLERLERVNRTLSHVQDLDRTPLRRIDTLLISPSRDLAAIAEPLYHLFPASIRYLLAVLGARRGSGRRLMSYLLFERQFCQTLVDLGYRDAMERESEIREFLQA
ncbi:MAG TPA: patatin-like phospholipase family protein [Arenicellales bacterium]|nr:patatin-like phospholipase family protein [Arenicellales bacterium]